MAKSWIAPAGVWRAFFVGAAFASALPAAPPAAAPPPLLQLGRADQADGRAALEQMRRLGIAGNYFLEFQLHVRPRRGDEWLIDGKLWGGRNADGPVSRVSLVLPAGQAGAGTERRLLIQNGPRAAAWRRDTDGKIVRLGVAELFEPIVPDTEMTAFDLMMPFLYWNDFTYEGLARFSGRPAHVIVLRPPADFALRHPALKGVRVRLDTQFNALVQTELLGAGDVVTKTFSLVDLKKIGEQWVPRTFDLRDDATRNKTRFDVTAVALDLDFAAALFEPATLAEDIKPPTGGALKQLGP